MKKLLRVGAYLLLLLVLLGVGGYAWASNATARAFERSVEVHEVDFPIPYAEEGPAPVEGSMVATDGTTSETISDATTGALERGAHLVSARYGCQDCHGEDFSGGVMMDAMPVGRMFGPNLTLGEGSVTREYTAADWDRAVRHGVGTDGRPLVMPALDFQLMSDQELADIVTYIRSFPPVENEVPPISLGPVGKLLIARGAFQFSADLIPDHRTTHPARPPEAAPTVEFGRHLAATCMGCHKTDYTGGDIGGDPSWVPAANLTPAGPMADLTLDEFRHLLREGVRPDGTEMREPMTFVLPFAQKMTDVEIEAIYLFLRSLPPREAAD